LCQHDEIIVKLPPRREPFVGNAENIFEAAQSALSNGGQVSDLNILIGEDGAIRIVADSGWSLESLCAERGARMAYRVSQDSDRLRVEGRAGSRTCLFETVKPDGAARLLLDNSRRYAVASAPALLA
jgi:hypothetical protein